jgi:pimeloyl-ACP methyl ester carboxylesterase
MIAWVEVPDGVRIAVHDFGGPERGPVVVFCHANGFAARSYAPMLAALAAQVRVLAMDLRGHGESTAPQPPYAGRVALDLLALDFAAVVDHAAARFPGAAIHGAAHSLGALLPIQDLLRGRSRLKRAVLLEAAVFPPQGHEVHAEAEKLNSDRSVRIPRRRSVFATPEMLGLSLSGAPAFAGVSAEHLRLHCEATLRQEADGAYHLRCKPEIEGLLYGEVARASQYNGLHEIAVPTLLVGADPLHPGSTWVSRMQPFVQRRIPGSQSLTVEGAGHLLPLEQPEQCAERIAEWVLP